MKISVLICTRNRAQSLARTLQTLLALPNGGAYEYEVVVVDNASQDETRAVVEKLRRRHTQLRYCYEARAGLSYARNTAIRQSAGEVLAFTDDDVLVSESWLAEIVREFSTDPQLYVLGGRVLLARDGLATVAFLDGAERRLVRFPNAGDLLMGANMVFRRQLFAEIGFFDVRLGAGRFFAGGEDTEIVYRALKAGHYVLYAPNVLVYHDHDRVTEAQACRLEYSYGKSYAAYLFKHILRGDKYAAQAFYWSALGLRRRLQRWPDEPEARWRRRRAHTHGVLVGLLTAPWVMGWGNGETRFGRGKEGDDGTGKDAPRGFKRTVG
jgi:glycosyltransferase involved in cell wall biosynthesis